MSASSLSVIRGLILRGQANLDTIATWETKKLLTAAEAENARAYWHELYDPPPPPPEPAPAPTPEPAPATVDAPTSPAQSPVEEPTAP